MHVRSFLPILALALIGTTAACSDTMAPEPPKESVSLPPFDFPIANIIVGFNYGQSLTFYAPVGIAPVVKHKIEQISANSPKIEITTRLETVLDPICEDACSRTTWRLTIFFKAELPGEAIVSFYDQSDPTQMSSFRIIAVEMDGKG